MNRKGILCLILFIGMLLTGCITDQPANQDPNVPPEPDTEHVTVQGGDASGQPMTPPDPDATPGATVPDKDTVPNATNKPNAGDGITDRFPDYDTGANADYSYQSDELRIAINKVVDEDEGQIYYVADIWIRSISSFRMGFAHGTFNTGHENPEEFAARDNVIFGISGSFNKGLVIHNGEEMTKNVESKLIDFTSGIMVIYQDGTVKVINRNKDEKFSYAEEQKKHGGIRHALQFGPILVQDGKALTGLKKKERHPRIIFGYYEPGHYVAVAVDGRKKNAIGMTETEMAELMERLGCECAMNLDGGTSAVMLFMGKTINTPSGVDRDGDGVAGRNIVDLLEFAEYDANGVAPDLSTVHADRFLGE